MVQFTKTRMDHNMCLTHHDINSNVCHSESLHLAHTIISLDGDERDQNTLIGNQMLAVAIPATTIKSENRCQDSHLIESSYIAGAK